MGDVTHFKPEFNPEADLRIMEIGVDRTRLIIVDNALRNPDDLVAYAARQAMFSVPKDTIYPGLNAPLGRDFILGVVAVLRAALHEAYGVPGDYNLVCDGYLGLVTASPEALTPYQAIPHIDTTIPAALAILLYLCDETHGGTGFYRHRATGFETLTSERMPDYNTALEAELIQGSDRSAGFFDDSDGQFERIAKVSAAFNRLIVYPSNHFHSAIVGPSRLNADPRLGRLTANIFVTG